MSEPIVSDKKFCERLRRQADDGHHWDRVPAMLRESAERIERLTRENEKQRDNFRMCAEHEEINESEINRLRAALINAIAPYARHGERVPPWVADARAALGEPKP